MDVLVDELDDHEVEVELDSLEDVLVGQELEVEVLESVYVRDDVMVEVVMPVETVVYVPEVSVAVTGQTVVYSVTMTVVTTTDWELATASKPPNTNRFRHQRITIYLIESLRNDRNANSFSADFASERG